MIFKNWTEQEKKFFISLTDKRAIGILFILGIVSYFKAVFFPFVHDDFVFIVNNPHIARWDDLGAIFLNRFSLASISPLVNAYYRPLLEILYKAEYLAFGLNPQGYHGLNILLHLANGVCVYQIAKVLLKEKRLSFFAAALFLVHPIQTEAVLAIAGISNLLLSFFCFLSFWLYLLSRQDSVRIQRSVCYGLSLLFFALALLTKEQAVVWPFLILLYEITLGLKSGERPEKKAWMKAGGFFLILGGYFLLRKVLLGSSLPESVGPTVEDWLRILAIPKTVLIYLRLLLFPTDLHYYRCLDILKFSVYWAWGLVFIFHLTGMLLRTFAPEHRRLALFFLGWFFLTLLPVVGIFPIMNEYSLALTAEHFLYFSFPGFVIFMLCLLSQAGKPLLKEKKEIGLTVLLSIVILIFVSATIRQSQYWRGEIPLFKRTLQFEKNLGRIRILLARAYYFKKQYPQALTEYRKALMVMKGHAYKAKGSAAQDLYLNFIKDIHFDSAHCYEALGTLDKAVEEYSLGLAVDPSDPVLHNNLGSLFLRLNQPDQAMIHFQKAFVIAPSDVSLLNNLAICFLQKGQLQDAQRFLRQALSLDPENLLIKKNLEELLKEEN